jgi:PAT family beta-lactamase induction signal transducer AmpG
MSSRFESLRIYRRPRLLAILFMGFSSGLPLPLTFATLSFWLAETGISRTEIGLFVLLGFAYNYKFLWSPLIDRLPIPGLTRRLGRRRGWALAIQLPLMLAILALGQSDPRTDLSLTALLAVLVSFLSASQDIVIDAYRVELLKPEEQGAGAAATQWGYRVGNLAAGAGALYAAHFGGWHMAYAIMAGLMLIGIATVLLTPEPAARGTVAAAAHGPGALAAWMRTAVVEPFADFIARPGWAAILVFIVLYKFGDALAGVMSNPFYVALGFTKIEVANISKLVGFFATLGGVALGGMATDRWGLYRSLLACGLLQMLSNLMYVAQAWAGHDTWMLTASIFTENLAGGMGSAAFVAYLSSLCNAAFTATQYALFSSLAALPIRLLSAPAGWLSEHLDWPSFFFVTTLAGVPGLVMLLWVMWRFPDAAMPRKAAMAADD